MRKSKKAETGHKVKSVKKGSPADRAGIKPGWSLVRVDSQPVKDIIDYKILTADDRITMLFLTSRGYLRRLNLNTPGGIDPGINFDAPTVEPLQRCANNCLFCFVDQNPPSMRDPLYVKDDDYRLSFLYGNFITLNRITEKELQRIIKLRLSPLYVSIHTTNDQLREKMCGTKLASKGLETLKKLVSAGIKIHAQAVLCPGLNTGAEMIKTISDLEKLGPAILSLALVPVGLTSYRDGLFKLRPFEPREAQELIGIVKNLQNEFLKTRGSRFVFPSDEFFATANHAYPEEAYYEGYGQLENGVGLARIFLDELDEAAKILPEIIDKPLQITLVTGKSASPILNELVNLFGKIKNLKVRLIVAENKFFGNTVTVAGLLTGNDLLDALGAINLGDQLFISHSQIREGSDLFLDGMTIKELSQKLGVPVKAASGPLDLLKKIETLNAVQAS